MPGTAQNFTNVSAEKQYTCQRQTEGSFIAALLDERVEVKRGKRERKRRRDRIGKVKTAEGGKSGRVRGRGEMS